MTIYLHSHIQDRDLPGKTLLGRQMSTTLKLAIRLLPDQHDYLQHYVAKLARQPATRLAWGARGI
jgi:hypothetical protein